MGWGSNKSRPSLLGLGLLAVMGAFAETAEVYVTVCTETGGVIEQISQTAADTATKFVTQKAPTLAGYIFTHWTLSTSQSFAVRDAWGRTLDQLTFTPYEHTTVTAHYLSSVLDSDQDGMPDGYELYWYGDLTSTTAQSDTDGDGFTFAEEIQNGTNPLFADAHASGVWHGDGGVLWYNPDGYKLMTMRCDPDGEFFITRREYLKPGTRVDTELGSVKTTTFAYWTTNGVRVADAWGRAKDSFSFLMPNEDIDVVAVTERKGIKRNWMHYYGNTEVDLNSDTDGDGFSFAQEMQNGTNPLFADATFTAFRGVVHADSDVSQYNADRVPILTIRCEPEGELFATTQEYVKPGKEVKTDAMSVDKSTFAYWTFNGQRMTDAWGRSVDVAKFAMPTYDVELVAVTERDELKRKYMYWTGSPSPDLTADVDKDGYTLAQELQQGTNPYFPNYTVSYNGVVHDDAEMKEMNLQVYEDVSNILVDGHYTAFFASVISGLEGVEFGEHATPVMFDWNGDGKRDLFVGYAGGARLFLNTGSNVNPDLTESTEFIPESLQNLFKTMTQPALAKGTGVLYFSDAGGTINRYELASGAITETSLKGRPGVFNASDWAAKQVSGGVGLTHRWSFNGEIAGDATGIEISSRFAEADSIGGQHAGFKGIVTSDGNQITLAGGSRNTSYVDLGANMLPRDGSPATIEIWSTQRSAKNWSRLIDIGNSTSDNFYIAWSNGSNINNPVMGMRPYPAQDCSGLGAYALNTEVYTVITFEPQSEGNWKITAQNRNAQTGAAMGSVSFLSGTTDDVVWTLAKQGQNNCWLGHSQYGADNDANASYNEVRVWNRVLTEEECTAHVTAGPDQDLAIHMEAVEAKETLVALGPGGSLTTEDGSTYSVDEALFEGGTSISFGDANNDGLTDILAGDAVGHIWFYQRTSETSFTLQNKVWGGSYEGFAKDLAVCATDWDDDGDLDAIVGTADGRLFLLRDPAGGRPSNVSLSAGVDSVSLKWDPNAQSRIRGYYVYRSAHGANAWTRVNSTTTPRYLDKPGQTATYDYSVTSISRLYKTGNSRPITVESAKTDPLSANVGTVGFTWQPSAAFSGDNVSVELSVENALNLSAENFQLKVSFDPAVLVPTGVTRSGITEELKVIETRGPGTWLVVGAGGTIKPGSGVFLAFNFAVADGTKLADTQVKIEEFELKSVGNRNVIPDVLKPGDDVELGGDSPNPDDPAVVVPGSRGDLDGDGRLGWNDVELFLKWKDTSSKDIPEAIRVRGDFNGDGVMDNRDYILLKRFFRERERLGGQMNGWNDNHKAYRGQ